MSSKRPLDDSDSPPDGRVKRSRREQNGEGEDATNPVDEEAEVQLPHHSRQQKRPAPDDEGELDLSDDDDGGRTGIIETITLKNFMCHTSLEVSLDTNLNFIVGRNGSGKSAVMTALTVGLGGRARDTSRGSSIKTFIKSGKTFGEVAIVLTNAGKDAFKPELYGDKIIIERRFTHTSSNYKIKSSTGHTVSNKSDELSRLLDHFNVQVDNPICMLNQDTSRNFLFSKKPEDKYNFFLKATELEKMTEEYEVANNCHAEALEFIDNKKETLPHLEAELKSWEKKAKAFTSIDELKGKVNGLKNELVWTLVSQDEKKLTDLERGVKEAEDRRPAHQRKVDESEQNVIKANEEKKKLEATVGDITKRRDEFDVQLKELAKNKSVVTAEKTKAETKLKFLTRELNQLQKEVKLLEDRIAAILQQNGKDYSEEKRKREEDIQKLEIQMAEIKAQMATTEHQLDQFNRCIGKYKEDLYVRQREHGEKSANIRNLKSEIAKIKKSKNDKWLRFGDWVPRAKADIQAAVRRGAFTAEPKGPMGAYLTLKHEEYALSIECCLGQHLRSWVVDNSKDLAVLEKIVKKYSPQLPNFTVSKFINGRHDISRHQADNSSHPGLFDLVDISDPVVFNYLVDARGCENVLFILDSDEARPILQRNPPPGCKEAFTRTGDQIYAGGPGGSYRYYSADANVRVRFLVADNAAHVAVMEEEARRLEADLDAVAEDVKKIQAEMEENKRAKCKDEQRMNKLRSSLAKLQTNWSDLRAIEDPMPIDVTTLREDLDHHKNEIRDKQEAADEWKTTLREIDARAQKAKEEFDAVQANLFALVTNSETDALRLNNLLMEFPKLQSAITHYQQKLHQLDEDIEKRGKDRNAQKELVEQRVQKALGVCPRMRTKRAPQNLQQEIVQIEKRIASEEQIHGDKEVVMASFREKKLHVEGIKSKVAGLAHFAKIFTEVMKNRQANMESFKDMLAKRTRAFFANMLNQRRYRGQLKFDHANQTLDIHVQPQADASQQGDMRQLSGGERSFSTVCFILSLWEAMESPFRCLDEFDVFMDNVNRTIAMEMMIHTTSKHKEQQFIFLSPLDMSHLSHDTKMKIFQMPDPER